MIYKVSYVISDRSHSGLIRNEEHLPQVGETVSIGNRQFRVREVIELIPARGDWGYYHVTCDPIPLQES